MKKELVVIILAAGRGKRLGGKNQKVVRHLMGKPLLSYLLPTVKSLNPQRIIIVVGFQKEEVFSWVRDDKVEFVEQKEPRGTGHAVATAEEKLRDYRGDILILCGDVPFLTEKTLLEVIEKHQRENNAVTVLTAITDNPTGYGRIVRDGNSVIAIVEELNASAEQKAIKEINAGIYVFKSWELFQTLPELVSDPIKGEYYLTDVIGILARKGYQVGAHQTLCREEVMGINTEEDLKRAEEWLRQKNETRDKDFVSRRG